jgi:hypothetical protein
MIVHSVYFWLKPGLSTQQVTSFRSGLVSLSQISSVRHAHIGIPGPTDRPIIERGYSYALIVQFDDQAAHDLYQEIDVHQRFRDTCGQFWGKVVIYDSVSAPGLT